MDETVKSLRKWFLWVGAFELFWEITRWLTRIFLLKSPVKLTLLEGIFEVAWTVALFAFLYAGIALKKRPLAIKPSKLWLIVIAFGVLVIYGFVAWKLPELLSREQGTGFSMWLAFRLFIFGVLVYKVRRLSAMVVQEADKQMAAISSPDSI